MTIRTSSALRPTEDEAIRNVMREWHKEQRQLNVIEYNDLKQRLKLCAGRYLKIIQLIELELGKDRALEAAQYIKQNTTLLYLTDLLVDKFQEV